MAYTKDQIAEMLSTPQRKVLKRTVTFWVDQGLIHPDDDREPRRGRARRFSDRNLIEYGMVYIMTGAGIDLDTIRLVMDGIQPEAGYIDNFFSDPKIGRERDFAFIEHTSSTGKKIQNFTATDKNSVLKFMGYNPKNPKTMARIIWLGQIKQQATELVKK
jgi:DNA-binding transcriptional MerR regulator